MALTTTFSLGSTHVQAASGYRLLKLNGSFVQWFPRSSEVAVSLRYAFVSAQLDSPGAVNCGRIGPADELLQRSHLPSEALERAAASAFAMWQSAINVNFERAASIEAADIIIGAQIDPVGFAFTNVSTAPSADNGEPPAVRGIDRALICLNPQKVWKVGADGNLAIYDLIHTFAHEIGHALGLDHPDDPRALMSFRYHEHGVGLTPGDVLGGTLLYGGRENGPTAVSATRHDLARVE